MLELKVMLTKVIENFTIFPITRRDEVVFIADLVLRPKDPIMMKFKPRNWALHFNKRKSFLMISAEAILRNQLSDNSKKKNIKTSFVLTKPVAFINSECKRSFTGMFSFFATAFVIYFLWKFFRLMTKDPLENFSKTSPVPLLKNSFNVAFHSRGKKFSLILICASDWLIFFRTNVCNQSADGASLEEVISSRLLLYPELFDNQSERRGENFRVVKAHRQGFHLHVCSSFPKNWFTDKRGRKMAQKKANADPSVSLWDP